MCSHRREGKVKLTDATTRKEYLAHLQSSGQSNQAIFFHALEVAAMTDDAWILHREKLLKMPTSAAAKRIVDDMVLEGFTFSK